MVALAHCTVCRRYKRISRNRLPFLLNFRDRHIRYYRHGRKKCFVCRRAVSDRGNCTHSEGGTEPCR